MNHSKNDCIYLRKSRMDLEAEPVTDINMRPDQVFCTLARHETQLLELADRINCHVTSIYREIVSGETIAARPVIRQLIKEIELGLWRNVLVMDLDRLARGNTMDQGRIMEAFQYSGTAIVTPLKIYDPQNEYDEEYMEFGLFMSHREYRMINRRIQRGRFQSAREGKYIGNIPPYGYLRQKLPGEKGWTLIPHPGQASVVQEIFIRCSFEHVHAPAIAEQLNTRNIPSASGRPWTSSSIHTILKNPVYAGFVKYGARPRIKQKTGDLLTIHRPCARNFPLFKGRHPALISTELFFSVNKKTYQRTGTSGDHWSHCLSADPGHHTGGSHGIGL